MYIQLKVCGVYKLYNKTMVIYKVISKNYKDCSSYCCCLNSETAIVLSCVVRNKLEFGLFLRYCCAKDGKAICNIPRCIMHL